MTRTSVKLVSAEGFEYIVDHKAACVSNTIKQMLSSEGDRLTILIMEVLDKYHLYHTYMQRAMLLPVDLY